MASLPFAEAAPSVRRQIEYLTLEAEAFSYVGNWETAVLALVALLPNLKVVRLDRLTGLPYTALMQRAMLSGLASLNKLQSLTLPSQRLLGAIECLEGNNLRLLRIAHDPAVQAMPAAAWQGVSRLSSLEELVLDSALQLDAADAAGVTQLFDSLPRALQLLTFTTCLDKNMNLTSFSLKEGRVMKVWTNVLASKSLSTHDAQSCATLTGLAAHLLDSRLMPPGHRLQLLSLDSLGMLRTQFQGQELQPMRTLLQRCNDVHVGELYATPEGAQKAMDALGCTPDNLALRFLGNGLVWLNFGGRRGHDPQLLRVPEMCAKLRQEEQQRERPQLSIRQVWALQQESQHQKHRERVMQQHQQHQQNLQADHQQDRRDLAVMPGGRRRLPGTSQRPQSGRMTAGLRTEVPYEQQPPPQHGQQLASVASGRASLLPPVSEVLKEVLRVMTTPPARGSGAAGAPQPDVVQPSRYPVLLWGPFVSMLQCAPKAWDEWLLWLKGKARARVGPAVQAPGQDGGGGGVAEPVASQRQLLAEALTLECVDEASAAAVIEVVTAVAMRQPEGAAALAAARAVQLQSLYKQDRLNMSAGLSSYVTAVEQVLQDLVDRRRSAGGAASGCGGTSSDGGAATGGCAGGAGGSGVDATDGPIDRAWIQQLLEMAAQLSKPRSTGMGTALAR